MEKLSRVKKYEDLRKQIEHNSIGTNEIPEPQLQNYAQRLNDIDPSIFKKVSISDEEIHTPERERKTTSFEKNNDTSMGEFRNEYLDDFINEVREYNIKKGNRENENTQIDILNQLNAVSRAKRSNYVENIEDDVEEKASESTTMSKEEIAAEVANLLKEDKQLVLSDMEPVSENEQMPTDEHTLFFKKDVISEPVTSETLGRTQNTNINDLEKTKVIEPQEHSKTEQVRINEEVVSDVKEKKNPFISRKVKPTVVPNKEEQQEAERERLLQQKLVEETQQLRVQLNEYEGDLNELSEGVEKTNKMLNVILGFLILALLVIIGIIVYWVINAGGIM